MADLEKGRYIAAAIFDNSICTEQRTGNEPWNKHMVIKTPKKRMIYVSDDDSHDGCVIIRGKE